MLQFWHSCGSAGSRECHSSISASPKQLECEPGTPCRGIVGLLSGRPVPLDKMLGESHVSNGVGGQVICSTDMEDPEWTEAARQEALMVGVC